MVSLKPIFLPSVGCFQFITNCALSGFSQPSLSGKHTKPFFQKSWFKVLKWMFGIYRQTWTINTHNLSYSLLVVNLIPHVYHLSFQNESLTIETGATILFCISPLTKDHTATFQCIIEALTWTQTAPIARQNG